IFPMPLHVGLARQLLTRDRRLLPPPPGRPPGPRAAAAAPRRPVRGAARGAAGARREGRAPARGGTRARRAAARRGGRQRRATGREGRVVVGSWYGTRRAAVELGTHFHRGRLTVRSSQVSRINPALAGRWSKARRLAFALELLRRIRPGALITHRFPVERAA